MIIGEGMNDGLFVAQINFIIGRVYNIKQENERSIYFHEKHLNLARQFQDSKGQYRAYFILSQLYEKINQSDKAKKYLSLYKSLAREFDKSNDGKNNFLKVCLKYFFNNIYLIFFVKFRIFVPNQLVLIYLNHLFHNLHVRIQLLRVQQKKKRRKID